MNLIIVESPAKGRTIENFLGKEYLVRSSYGHIRDLPEKELGVDTEQNFEPKYVVPYKAKKRIAELKNYLSKAGTTIIATDEDREGEAIAWHLTEVLGLNGKKPYQRIVFHEITKQAIEQALKNPRKIDINLVNAQQARRILDRLVGYKLSPFLWKKVFRGLSAGRVQSVAVRLVVEREREIQNFVPQEYWSIEALLQQIQKPKVKSQNYNSKVKTELTALLIKKDGKVIPKLAIKNKEGADEIVKDLEGTEYKVLAVERKEVKKNPLPPFTTSTLQQESWQRFRLPAKMTMRIAQQLYERGFITYHRTDSLNLSTMSQAMAKKFIQENYGIAFWPGFCRIYKIKSKSAQEAHEAIRPTRPDFAPQNLGGQAKFPDKNTEKLYELIWRRFTACQMSEARFDSSQVDVAAKNYIFRATGQTLKFDGFLKVYPMRFEEAELPLLEKGEILDLKNLIPSQHFTQPPPRYSEATLIKTLEKEGIGRPSTYAPILETIQQRNYVGKNEQKKFQPTEIGILVNDLLVRHFPRIVDIKFTAFLEDDLDKIANGKKNWQKTLQTFYQPFEKNLKEKEKEVSKKELTEKTGRTCPECAGVLVSRWSRYGKFYACSNFPKCKYKESIKKPTLGIRCPKCQEGEITEKKTKRGSIFYGCNRWPNCDFALWDKPNGGYCPRCGSLLVETAKKPRYHPPSAELRGKQVKCSNKECTYGTD